MHSIENIGINKIKEISKLQQKKYRDESGLFIAEGIKAVTELINEHIEIQYIFALKDTSIEKINMPVIFVEESIMKKISTTSSPCEILAVAKQKVTQKKEFSKLKKIILLDSISDPGNFGTIIRSTAAFGIEGIILFGNCVDLYSPKVIRSSAGNFFKTPIIKTENTEEIKNMFPEHLKISTSLSDTNNISIKECKEADKYLIMFGSEANGLCSELINITDRNIKLEMKNNVESLNLSVSVSIIMYELSTY